MQPTRPRVGLLVPRSTVFDRALGPVRVDRLRRRRALLARALEPYADVVASVSFEDESDATLARRAFNDSRIDLVVVAPAMAAPPSLALWLGRRLAGAALYTEWCLSQPGDGDALLLSCGLADLAFGLPGTASRYEVTGVRGVRGTASGVPGHAGETLTLAARALGARAIAA
jgi:hypothetical protein